MNEDIALLHKKIDALTAQVAYLTEQAEEQRKRQQAMDELKNDLVPIANHFIKLTIDELAEIDTEFQLEDLLYLFKRVLRNTNLILAMMDRAEALMGLADEAEILSKQVFHTMVEELDRMEREGYFAFAQEGWRIIERIVTEFSEEDVRALADNIVTIVTTVRNMTQPEILALANNAVGAISEIPADAPAPSTLALLKEFSDPKVRKGLQRMLNLVKAIADQPTTNVTPIKQ